MTTNKTRSNTFPAQITLSAAELELAIKYVNGDFSGGYVACQIACFRRGLSEDVHQARREKFARLKQLVDAEGLTLPPALSQLVETDEYVNRLRHNNIWLTLPDELAPLPSDPTRKMFLIFREGQGCGYWHLLLSPEGTHVVAYSDEPFGVTAYPSWTQPDLAAVQVYKCADSFGEWIVNYFLECRETDRHYEEMLAKEREG